MKLHSDFKDFLKLLNSKQAKYLVVGGYAVGYYGYPRATGDLDIWISNDAENASKVCEAVRQFGFDEARAELFIRPGRVVRMGNPPIRIEILTTMSGVDFSKSYERRESAQLDGIGVELISLSDLRLNKSTVGRHKDLADLENLPDT